MGTTIAAHTKQTGLYDAGVPYLVGGFSEALEASARANATAARWAAILQAAAVGVGVFG